MKVILKNSDLVLQSIAYVCNISSDGGVVPLITITGNGEIRFTKDGTIPTSSSEVYDKPFYVLASCTIKAAVFVNGVIRSDVESLDIAVDAPDNTWYNGQSATIDSSTTSRDISNGNNSTNAYSGDTIAFKFVFTQDTLVGKGSLRTMLRTSSFGNVLAMNFDNTDGWDEVNKEYILVTTLSTDIIIKYASVGVTGTITDGEAIVQFWAYRFAHE